MKATELRIGNLVYSDGEVFTVDMLTEKAIGFDGMLTKESNVKPIPLTEEWLERFGFEFEGFRYQLEINNNLFVIVQHEDGYYLPFNSDCVIFNTVHQLQNLYFALTGEELTIKTEDK